MTTTHTYIAIDLKSFFASVECVERGLNPLSTNLVVADKSRTSKTICLAVSPSLKAYGIGGRARLFEVEQRMRDENHKRWCRTWTHRFSGKSFDAEELAAHADWEIDYIVAPPRMSYYIEYSTRVYKTYLKYVAPEDIHVYSIDEVFMDVTPYLDTYGMTAHQLAITIIRDVLQTTGITATAGIGTNMYLAKIAMDIVAKHMPADSDGVRIAELDEMAYRRKLWDHRPLTDFWRIGKGIANKLALHGMFTMGDIALQSVRGEERLYQLFGVNAELIIDHAWGWEPCTIDYIKAYRPEASSFSSGQVLHSPYEFDKARVVIYEMADAAAMKLFAHHMTTDQITLDIGYDTESLTPHNGHTPYNGETYTDRYGRTAPRPAHGSTRLPHPTSSAMLITEAVLKLFDRIVDKALLIRRLNITTCNVTDERQTATGKRNEPIQLDLFADNEKKEAMDKKQKDTLDKERRMQKTLLDIKKRFGKNSILRGISYCEGATARERNKQIGGHKA